MKKDNLIIVLWINVFIFYLVGDMLTTLISQLTGIREGNPIIRPFIEYHLVLGLLVLLIFKIIILYIVYQSQERKLLYTLILLGCLVTVHNTICIMEVIIF